MLENKNLEMVSKSKFKCLQCGEIHTLTSKIGMKHRGIKVIESKRRTFSFVYPNGELFKTTSIFDLKYAVIHYNPNSNKWYNSLCVEKEEAEHRIKVIQEMHSDGCWLEYTQEQIISF